jgi:hypothetical protein
VGEGAQRNGRNVLGRKLGSCCCHCWGSGIVPAYVICPWLSAAKDRQPLDGVKGWGGVVRGTLASLLALASGF